MTTPLQWNAFWQHVRHIKPLNLSLSRGGGGAWKHQGGDSVWWMCVCVCVSMRQWERWRAANTIPAHTGVSFSLLNGSMHFSGLEKTFLKLRNFFFFCFFSDAWVFLTGGVLNLTLEGEGACSQVWTHSCKHLLIDYPTLQSFTSSTILNREWKPAHSLNRSAL